MISHRNVIANTIQVSNHERQGREAIRKGYQDVVLGLLPLSHIYGLIVICHCSSYRGDQVVVLPKFEIQSFLGSIQKYHINTLFIVPPIIIAMVKNHSSLKKFDLRSVRAVFSGAARNFVYLARASLIPTSAGLGE